MKRVIVILSVIVLMFASSGMHKLAAAQLGDQDSQQIALTVEVSEQAQQGGSDDCCAKSQHAQHSSHDQCSAACAVLIEPASVKVQFSSNILAVPLIEEMESAAPGLLKRPPRTLL